jgi:hypothetical protein
VVELHYDITVHYRAWCNLQTRELHGEMVLVAWSERPSGLNSRSSGEQLAFELRLFAMVREVYNKPEALARSNMNPALPTLMPQIMAGMALDAVLGGDLPALSAFLLDVLQLPRARGWWETPRWEATVAVLRQPGWRRIAKQEGGRLFAWLSRAIWRQAGRFRVRNEQAQRGRQWDRLERALDRISEEVEAVCEEGDWRSPGAHVAVELPPKRRRRALADVTAAAASLRAQGLSPIQERLLAALEAGSRPIEAERLLGCGPSPYRSLINRTRRLQRAVG